MKKILLMVALAAPFLFAKAQVPISQLPAAGAQTGVEVLPEVQNGATKKVSVNQLRTYITSTGAHGATGYVQYAGQGGRFASDSCFTRDSVKGYFIVKSKFSTDTVYTIFVADIDGSTVAGMKSISIDSIGTLMVTGDLTNLGLNGFGSVMGWSQGDSIALVVTSVDGVGIQTTNAVNINSGRESSFIAENDLTLVSNSGNTIVGSVSGDVFGIAQSGQINLSASDSFVVTTPKVHMQSDSGRSFIMGKHSWANAPFYGIIDSSRFASTGFIGFFGIQDLRSLGGDYAFKNTWINPSTLVENGTYNEVYQGINSTWSTSGRYENLVLTDTDKVEIHIRDKTIAPAKRHVKSVLMNRDSIYFSSVYDTVNNKRIFLRLKDSDTSIAFKIADQSLISLPQHAGSLRDVLMNDGTGQLEWEQPVNSDSLETGIYTPDDSAVANVDAVTFQPCLWERNGTHVHISGFFSVDPTLISTTTTFEMTVPIAGGFDDTWEGNLSAVTTLQPTVFVGAANTTTGKIVIGGFATFTSANTYRFEATYLIK